MKIFAILLVKDEADIIGAALQSASEWADGIFILDNGSSDGTWELLQSMKSDVIHPWRQELTPYRRSLRADIFNHFRDRVSAGDWWCNMDADEFYVDNPRQFLSRVAPRYHVVFKKSIDYRLTREDVAEHQFSGRFEDDRAVLRYIEPRSWMETRFFRHRARLQWHSSGPKASSLPQHVGLHYPEPILARHYQYRSPDQIQRRLDVRNAVPRDRQGRPFKHIRHTRWEELLVDRAETVLDEGRSTYDALPERSKVEERLFKRIVKTVLHGLRIWP